MQVAGGPSQSTAGATWRGVIVGVVALLVFLVHPVLGIALILVELAWFGRLAARTGRGEAFRSRLFLVAAATIGALAVLLAFLALGSGDPIG